MPSLRDKINRPWFDHLAPRQQKLIELGVILCERESQTGADKLIDYGFIVFPVSKAYEGFLKKYLYDQGLITKPILEGRRFRIGRALNPDIRGKYRDEYWLYDDLKNICGPEIARQVWNTWLECRNRVFHYFAKDKEFLTYQQAVDRVKAVLDTIEAVANISYS